MDRTPESPSISACQNASFPNPFGATTPTPVTTTRLAMAALLNRPETNGFFTSLLKRHHNLGRDCRDLVAEFAQAEHVRDDELRTVRLHRYEIPGDLHAF